MSTFKGLQSRSSGLSYFQYKPPREHVLHTKAYMRTQTDKKARLVEFRTDLRELPELGFSRFCLLGMGRKMGHLRLLCVATCYFRCLGSIQFPGAGN